MSLKNSKNQSAGLSPLIWGIMAVIALAMVVVFFSGRSATKAAQISLGAHQKTPKFVGETTKQAAAVQTLAPTILDARGLIRLARKKGKPFPLDELYKNALSERANKAMENAHLLFFFCAREGHLPSILMMGEMADPLLFSADKSLLDRADPVQAYKWYRIAIERNNTEAQNKMALLQQWAKTQASAGNKTAQQLLLSFAK